MNRPIGLAAEAKKKKRNKRKTPVSLRIIRSTMKTLEKVSPKLATFVAWRLFCTPFRHKIPEREKAAHQSAQKSTLGIGHLSICTYRWGHPADPMVLFMHGWSGRATQVSSMLPHLLDAGYQVLAIDAPAHGQSDGKTTNILELVQVVEHLGHQFPLVAAIGHSFGGVALHYSSRNAILFSKLVTISSPMESTFILQDFMEKIGGTPALAQRIREYVRNKFNMEFDAVSPLYPDAWSVYPDWLIVHDNDDRDVPVNQAHAVKNHPLKPQQVFTSGLGHYRILRDDHVSQVIIDWLRR